MVCKWMLTLSPFLLYYRLYHSVYLCFSRYCCSVTFGDWGLRRRYLHLVETLFVVFGR